MTEALIVMWGPPRWVCIPLTLQWHKSCVKFSRSQTVVHVCSHTHVTFGWGLTDSDTVHTCDLFGSSFFTQPNLTNLLIRGCCATDSLSTEWRRQMGLLCLGWLVRTRKHELWLRFANLLCFCVYSTWFTTLATKFPAETRTWMNDSDIIIFFLRYAFLVSGCRQCWELHRTILCSRNTEGEHNLVCGYDSAGCWLGINLQGVRRSNTEPDANQMSWTRSTTSGAAFS